MKIFNIVFCVLFIVFAILQFNDPDPFIWITIYLFSATLCGLAIFGRYIKTAYVMGIGGFICYATYLLFSQSGVINWVTVHEAENIAGSMKASKPWIEETREFFGLLIQIIVLSVNLYHHNRQAVKANLVT